MVAGDAAGAGHADGLVSGYLHDEGDARGRFIRRPELPEASWPEYRDAFYLAYQRARRAA